MRIVVVVFMLTLIPWAALGLGKPENVLVVRNVNSPVSCRVAEYYMSRRGIPAGNLVSVATTDATLGWSYERITPANFEIQIRQPIVNFLDANGLTNTIQYIVLTKGIPHAFTNEPSEGIRGGRCVDSVLAATNLVNPIQLDIYENGTYAGTLFVNRYWLANEPFQHSKYGGYLVTRLDGYTEDHAKQVVDRALAPQLPPYRILLDEAPAYGLGNPALQPKSLLLPDGTLNPNYELYYHDFNADMTKAWQVISSRPHVSVQLDQTNTFVLSEHPLTGYISWGSNDPNFNANTYKLEPFAPASIAETAVSTSARTFQPVTSGQSVITDLIMPRSNGASGTAGVKGYVTEPYLDAVASPTALLDRYTSGRNLAESYYAASRFVGWKDLVVGDPLAALTGISVANPREAKTLADGNLISLSGVIVSAGTDAFGDRFYVQDQNRISGIQVRIGTLFEGIAEGMTVSVRGILSTIDGERVITNASVIF
ncbi:MAG: TIGR03790 family protein [Armatimonadetes bacterium]|nr:TIGR03790 family protein [Armatimonadota bacterium]